MESKKCTKCKIEKDFSCFYKHKQGKYGLSSACIYCHKEYYEKYREKNREKNRDFHVSHCKTTLADAKKKPVIRSDGKVYDSIKQASEKTGIGRTAINNCLAGRVKTSGGYGWKYLQGGVSSHT